MKKRKKDLNSNLLETFGFLIYLSVGFVFIFLIILSNIKVREISDPNYACGIRTDRALSKEKDMDMTKGITLKVKKADLRNSRLTLESYGMDVLSVNMNGKSPVMTINVRPENNDRLGYRLCQIKDSLAVSDFSFNK